jgi:hypothetical protein
MNDTIVVRTKTKINYKHGKSASGKDGHIFESGEVIEIPKTLKVHKGKFDKEGKPALEEVDGLRHIMTLFPLQIEEVKDVVSAESVAEANKKLAELTEQLAEKDKEIEALKEEVAELAEQLAEDDDSEKGKNNALGGKKK